MAKTGKINTKDCYVTHRDKGIKVTMDFADLTTKDSSKTVLWQLKLIEVNGEKLIKPIFIKVLTQ